MKVAFLSCVLPADNPRALLIMKSLLDSGHEIVALMAQAKAGSHVALRGIQHIPLAAPRANFLAASSIRSLLRAIGDRCRNLWRLYRLTSTERPDVCICHEPDSWLVGLLTKRKVGSCLLVDIREVYVDRAAAFPRVLKGLVAWGTKKAIRFLARRSDGLIHVSRHRAEHYNLRHPHSVVIHHRCDSTLFDGVEAKRPSGLEGRLIYIHAGPLRPNYAASEILVALEAADTRASGVVVVVVGGSAVAGSLNAVVNRMQRDGRLIVLPYVSREEIAGLIKGADVGLSLVLPVDTTHRLASPTKLYEYIAAGLPVIGSDVPEIREVLTRWKCGLLVDATKPEEIASAMTNLAADRSLRKSLAENARAAAPDLDWKTDRKTLIDFVAQRVDETSHHRSRHAPVPGL